MNSFSATTESEAVVAASPEQIWAVLTDPVQLQGLTPLLESIDADGDLWTWHMVPIKGLGVRVVPAFTEKMVFVENERIDYHHEAPAGTHERTGAEGWYVLEPVEGGTKLSISLTLDVELPLPKAAGGAVRKVMTSTITRTGEKFSENLLDHLGTHQIGGTTMR